MKNENPIRQSVCAVCGKPFFYKYRGGIEPLTCSAECRKKRNTQVSCIRNKVARSENRRELKKELKRAGKPFHDAMKECREQGISYAERQMQKTLKMLKEQENGNS